MKISEAELLEALASATQAGPSDAMTGPELQAMAGVGEKKLRLALKALKATGRLQVHTVMRPRLNGVMAPTFGYTVLPAKRR